MDRAKPGTETPSRAKTRISRSAMELQLDRGEDAQRDGHEPGDNGGQDGELSGHLKAGEDLGQDGLRRADGFPKITPEHAADPVQVLYDIGRSRLHLAAS